MEPIPAFNVELDPINGAFLCSSINLLEKMQKFCKRKSEIFSTFNFNISTYSLVRWVVRIGLLVRIPSSRINWLICRRLEALELGRRLEAGQRGGGLGGFLFTLKHRKRHELILDTDRGCS